MELYPYTNCVADGIAPFLIKANCMRKLYMYLKLTIVLFTLAIGSLSAQSDDFDTIARTTDLKKSAIEVSMSYMSNAVFAGRKDTVAVPYLITTVGYSHKTGVFFEGSVSYLVSSLAKRVDLFTLTGGYMYSKNNFIAGVDATKYFFNSSSTNVQSEMNGYAALFLGYQLKNILSVVVDGMVTFNAKPDFFVVTEVNHRFYAIRDQLTITPSAYLNFGTQNYYTEFVNYKRSGAGSGNGNGGGTQTTGVSVIASSAFQLLNYEFSLPIGFSNKKWSVVCTPVFAIPVNPSFVTIDGQIRKEEISNSFFWSLGVYYRFAKK